MTIGDFNNDGNQDLVLIGNVTWINNLVVMLGNGDGSFGPPSAPITVGDAWSIVAGDFNADGNEDLAIAVYTGGRVYVWMGNGDGTFELTSNYHMGNGLVALAMGDFNGDDRPDLAVIDGATQFGTLAILVGLGDGFFEFAHEVASGYFSRGLTLGDFDNDGNQDVAVYNVGNVSVFLGNGNGTMAAGPSTYSAGDFTYPALGAGDFNEDGMLDVAILHQETSAITPLLGNGDGAFRPASFYPTGFDAHDVSVGDFNGDGNYDLVMANELNNAGTISVHLGVGDGTFADFVTYPAGTNAYALTIGDFNSDGKEDIAVANRDGDHILSILLGHGDGSFQAPVSYAVTIIPYAIAHGDFNADGELDLVASSASATNVLLGNGDGTFQAAVVYASKGPVAVGDFNGDGKPDLITGGVNLQLGIGDGTFQTPIDYATALESAEIGDFNGDGFPDLVGNTFYGEAIVINAADWAPLPVSGGGRHALGTMSIGDDAAAASPRTRLTAWERITDDINGPDAAELPENWTPKTTQGQVRPTRMVERLCAANWGKLFALDSE